LLKSLPWRVQRKEPPRSEGLLPDGLADEKEQRRRLSSWLRGATSKQLKRNIDARPNTSRSLTLGADFTGESP
jgi:hypothetical protein